MGIKANLLELPTVEAIRKAKPENLDNAAPALVIPDAMFWNNRALLMELLASKKVPAVYPEREDADDGGMMAYGPNVPDNFRRAASYVDRIMKGANPGELPIQQPSRFDFVVNLRAARALGVELPQALLSSADEVIELATILAATGFQSRRGRCREPTPVTPLYAPLPLGQCATASRRRDGRP